MVCVGLDLRKQMPVKWRSQQLFKAALKIFQRQNLSKFENFEILKLDICKTRFLMGENSHHFNIPSYPSKTLT
jgi:hypothetical protein